MASPPSGRPGRDESFQAKMSKCTQGVARATNSLEEQRGGDRAGHGHVAGAADVGHLRSRAICDRAATAAGATSGRSFGVLAASSEPARASSSVNRAGSSGPKRHARGAGQGGEVDQQVGFLRGRPRPGSRPGSAGPRHRCCRSRPSGPCASRSRRAAAWRCPRPRSRPPESARAVAPSAPHP